ncbi:WUSCHEL-related homeobox 13-like [Pistacia vera]|uniref:WUSCHEL-related homeobox 13-like n=1 Tax=Pistacia vera TaxID=55513 RepID=UPI0012632569|nr:WUSCHEL-related homeobox 13-like [Pistacia vera]
MEWQNFQEKQLEEEEMRVDMELGQFQNGGLFVKVMTDEQMELLRKQIAVYTMLCEQLAQMHKAFSVQHDITGMRFGNPYFDPLLTSGGQKITARQRWTPTPVQLQILERVYDECTGTPNKQKIQEITSELAQHGQISETNVYNWFQNRRARIKRKQSGAGSNMEESEADTHVESKNKNPESIQLFENSAARAEHIFSQSPDIGFEQLVGKMEGPGSYSPEWEVEGYSML